MGYKIKTTSRDSAPTIVATVGINASAAPWTDRRGGIPHIIDRVHVCTARRTRRGWTPTIHHVPDGWAGVWDVLDALSSAGRRVYVVAGRASDALTLLRWWDRVEQGIYSIRYQRRKTAESNDQQKVDKTHKNHPLILNGRPDIVGYSHGQCSYRWVSATNWCDLSIADMASQVGHPFPHTVDGLDKWEACGWPAGDQADVVMKYIQRLINWWLANECGVFKDTPGAAAWASWLRKTADVQVHQHTDPKAMKLEDRACYGGRASAWYYGDVGNTDVWGELSEAPHPGRIGFGIDGPVHRFDVRSTYPALMRDNDYPVSLVRRETRCSIAGLKAGLKGMCALAAVRVDTPDGNLPLRVRGGIAYPTGRIDTVLTTPELIRALAAKRIRAVYEVAWYERGRPFTMWTDWGMRVRKQMIDAKDECGQKFIKLLTNSLGGRLARRKIGWVDQPHALAKHDWGQWPVWPVDEPEPLMYRALAGYVQRMEREADRPATLAACYAHMTAYGRLLMDDVRAVCGRRDVLWQDTDGVVVTNEGRSRLEASPFYHPTDVGKMRFERTIAQMRILTPKHYWADGQWVLAGVHDGFTVDEDMHSHELLTANPVREACSPDQAAVYRSVRHIDLRTISPGVQVGHDGWAIPPVVWRGEQPSPTHVGQRRLWDGSEVDELCEPNSSEPKAGKSKRKRSRKGNAGRAGSRTPTPDSG